MNGALYVLTGSCGSGKTTILRALAACNDNVAEAAKQLNTDRANLYRRMRRLGIER